MYIAYDVLVQQLIIYIYIDSSDGKTMNRSNETVKRNEIKSWMWKVKFHQQQPQKLQHESTTLQENIFLYLVKEKQTEKNERSSM